MTFLEDMNQRARTFGQYWHHTLASNAGITNRLLCEILRGERPMPAQLWEYLMKVQS